jgi:ubiquinol-cytochrome c reductase cytochrome b subunit
MFMKSIRKWFDERTGIHQLLKSALGEPIPGGARLAYVFGSGLLYLFISQVITGVFLSFYYCPSPVHAHTSLSYIVKVVSSGSFLRSLHAYGASAMVIVLILHFLQTFLYGSYKGKRELIWISGAVLGILVLGMTFTGYLLPWDQKAYFATTVGTNILAEIPGIGTFIKKMIRGGNQVGGLTLSRFFVVHVLILPGIIFALIGSHLFLFRKRGAAGPISEDPVLPVQPSEAFYPKQVALDFVFTFLLMAGLGLMARLSPAELGPIANPSDTQYLPRPEWFYRPLFQWLKYWSGSLSIFGILVIPLLILGLFFLLPFLDRGRERRPWKRIVPSLFVLGLLSGLGVLGGLSYRDDAKDPTVALQLKRQDEDAKRFLAEPFQPVIVGEKPVDPPKLVRIENSPQAAAGKKIYQEKYCNACHGEAAQGGSVAPALSGILKKYTGAQLSALLRNPNEKMKTGGMTALELDEPSMNALFQYLKSVQ